LVQSLHGEKDVNAVVLKTSGYRKNILKNEKIGEIWERRCKESSTGTPFSWQRGMKKGHGRDQG